MTEPMRLYLVLYDISAPRRWRRVYRRLKAHGAWAQLSAFFCRLPPARMDRLRGELAGLIDPDQDRLLVCDLGEAARAADRLSAIGRLDLPQPPRTLILL